jgi:hypothetical protein
MNGLGHGGNLPGGAPDGSIEAPRFVDFLHYIHGAAAIDSPHDCKNGAIGENPGKSRVDGMRNALRNKPHSV